MARSGIMLCYPFEEKRFIKWGSHAFIQPKLDGERCRALRTEQGVDLISSEGNRIYSTPHINRQLQKLDFQELDGELYLHGMAFEDIESIVKRTVNIHPSYQTMEFHIFDIVNDKPQAERFSELVKLKEQENIKIVSPRLVDSMDKIEEYMEQYQKDNYEGFVLRDIFAPYTRTRSTNMMKFKPKKTDIYNIIGYEQEMTIHKELKDSLGALVLDAGYGDGSVFRVGTGFTKEQRCLLWIDKELLPNKRCRIAFQSLTDKRGVPRFPVFMEVL